MKGESTIILKEEDFLCRNVQCNYSAVMHLRFHWLVTRYSVNFIPMDKTHEANMSIRLFDGNEFTFNIKESSFAKKQVAALRDVYVKLAQRTFQHRLSGYIAQIQMHGYFEYDNCHFYPGSHIIYRKKQTLHLSKIILLRKPSLIILRL